MGGETGGLPAGWYPDPSGEYRWRFWDPEEGWSGTAVSGPLDAGSRAEAARAGGWSRGMAIGTGAVLLLFVVFAGVLASRADWLWLSGRPLPPAPSLPPGAQVAEVIDSSDSDDGWIGIRGSAFTTDWSVARVHDFYRRQYPASGGWREVAPAADQQGSWSGLAYHCRARVLNADGDWELVLQLSGPANRRFVVLRAEMAGIQRQLQGAAPTMEGCLDATAWAAPDTVFDWAGEE